MKKATTPNKVRWVKYKLIKTDQQYHRYLNAMHRLREKDQRKHRDEIELLDFLTDRWREQKMMKGDPVMTLRWLINDKFRMSHFAKDLGVSKGYMSDIMNYMKPLSKDLIIRISQRYNLSAQLLARPYPLRTKRVKKPKLTEIDW